MKQTKYLLVEYVDLRYDWGELNKYFCDGSLIYRERLYVTINKSEASMKILAETGKILFFSIYYIKMFSLI